MLFYDYTDDYSSTYDDTTCYSWITPMITGQAPMITGHTRVHMTILHVIPMITPMITRVHMTILHVV